MTNIKTTSDQVDSLAASEIMILLDNLASPMRLASQSPNGFPLISTVWCLYEDETFWCITQARTLLRRNLSQNPRCAFEIGLEGQRFKLLRGQGLAVLDLADGGRVTERMINRYLADPQGSIAATIRKQISTEYAITIRPRWVRGQGAQ